MSNFFYYNNNPNSRTDAEDCVTRAIALAVKATNLQVKDPYRLISKLLELVAEAHKCPKLCVCCYHHLLEDVFGYEVRFSKGSKTVQDIATKHKNNVIIVRIQGHLTCCMYGTCIDIWDCSQEIVDCYWIVK